MCHPGGQAVHREDVAPVGPQLLQHPPDRGAVVDDAEAIVRPCHGISHLVMVVNELHDVLARDVVVCGHGLLDWVDRPEARGEVLWCAAVEGESRSIEYQMTHGQQLHAMLPPYVFEPA